MTHTKDTREAVARAIKFALSAYTSDNSKLMDCDLDDAATDILADLKREGFTISHLTALEPAPAQAGGDVRELVEKIAKSLREEIGIYTDYEFMPHTKEIERWLKPFLTATPAQLADQDLQAIVDAYQEGYNDRALVTGEEANWCDWQESFAQSGASNYVAARNSTQTDAQPTPSGEVDGLVAEIDALFEKASGQPWGLEKRTYSWNITGVSKGNHPGKVCLARTEQWGRTDDSQVDVPEMDANAALIVALVNAWPRLRTALGGGWRDDAEKWRALINCERVRVLGWTHDMNHIGLEFWKRHPAKHPSEEYPQDQDRSTLDSFVLTPALPPQLEGET